jgi:hypothetical protein
MIDGRQEKNAVDSKIFSGFVLGSQKPPELEGLLTHSKPKFAIRTYIIL